MRAVLARMCLTSRQLSCGWASSSRAMAPAALGVAAEVPLKLLM